MSVCISFLQLQIVLFSLEVEGMLSFRWPMSWNGQAGCHNVSFATHAKSGSQFASNLAGMLGGISGLTNFNFKRFGKTDIQSGNIVHFVRDPFALILSSYNYYTRGVEDKFHTRKLGPKNRARLGCESNVFFTCLWEKKTTAERLVVMARAYLWQKNAAIGLPLVDINTISHIYDIFEKLPNTINVCLEDLFADLVGTLGKVSDVISSNCPAIRTPSQLAQGMMQACDAGKCNTFAERLKYLRRNVAFKCCLHDSEEFCGTFEDEPDYQGAHMLNLLSWCVSSNPDKCKWVTSFAHIDRYPVKAYSLPPTNTTSNKRCHPHLWTTECDVDRTFVPAKMEDLHEALQKLDPETFNRVKEVSQSMRCGRVR